MTWLAVLVTIGVRSNAAALIAGMAFVLPAVAIQYYLPSWTWFTDVLSIGFGLGAISAAKFPDGVLAENSRKLRHLVLRFRPVTTELDTADASDFAVAQGPAQGATRVAEQVS
jgi:branched-chain amino acid transport system permease protein